MEERQSRSVFAQEGLRSWSVAAAGLPVWGGRGLSLALDERVQCALSLLTHALTRWRTCVGHEAFYVLGFLTLNKEEQTLKFPSNLQRSDTAFSLVRETCSSLYFNQAAKRHDSLCSIKMKHVQ